MACVAQRCILPGVFSKNGNREGTRQQRTCSSSRRGCGLAVRAGQAKEVKVCTKKECKRKGSLKTLAKFEALGLEVATVNCLGECGMWPNVQIKGDDGPIVNGVKTEEDVAKVVDRLLGE